ncbi:hypothetical protein [Pseudomonas aeruginosa]|uniref:hypothetical protein n=1 Tax=Pseudomonas aeruginosa TaxID=287 RepID=UPI0021B4554B|nr:hypothetical protein [Pseudomonas aeruginosa]MCT7417833.1 hypothetical protein [Pseudomonas aeruginosa]
MSSRSLLLALRVPGRSFRGGKYAQVVIVVGASFFFCKVRKSIIGTWVILIRKFRRPRRVAIFISLVYLAIQGGFFVMEPSSNPSEAGKVFYCVVRSGDWVLFNTTVYLKGDKCPEGSDLDLTTGVAMCKPPEPEKPNDCIEGLYDLFSSPPSPVVQVGGRNQVISSPPAG